MTRKKPGPHTEKPLDTIVKARVDKETLEKLEYCENKLNATRSEALRKSINSLYEELHNK